MAHPPPPTGVPRSDERGVSLSAFVATVVFALLLMGGLAIDGGALSFANRECVQAASEAARAATDSGAQRRAVGLAADPGKARAAAQEALAAHPGVAGEVTIKDGVVFVTTKKRISTTFLSIIRINSLETDASSSAILAGTG